MKKHQATSLAELMVAVGIFGLISTYIALLIKVGFSYTRDAHDRGELQRTSLRVLSNIGRELAESNPDCLRQNQPGQPGWLVFASPRGDGGITYQGSNLLWKSWIAIYCDQNSKLLLREDKAITPAQAFKPDPGPGGLDITLAQIQSNPLSDRSLITRNVADFTASISEQKVELSLKVEVGEDEHHLLLTSKTTVHPRN